MFTDAGAYTIVKANTFNGIPLPTVYELRDDGQFRRYGGGVVRLFERELNQSETNGRIGTLDDIGRMIDGQMHDGQTPIRFAVSESSRHSFRYEIGILEGAGTSAPSMFNFHHRHDEDASAFNAVLVVPTGIGAEIGGHAGDATPVARLLASVC